MWSAIFFQTGIRLLTFWVGFTTFTIRILTSWKDCDWMNKVLTVPPIKTLSFSQPVNHTQVQLLYLKTTYHVWKQIILTFILIIAACSILLRISGVLCLVYSWQTILLALCFVIVHKLSKGVKGHLVKWHLSKYMYHKACYCICAHFVKMYCLPVGNMINSKEHNVFSFAHLSVSKAHHIT